MRKVLSISAALLLFAVFALSRCSKGYGPLDTTLTLYPTVQSTSNGWKAKIEGWTCYYYIPADTFTYTVKNLDDALLGRFTQRYGEDSFVGKEGQKQDSTWVRFPNIQSTSAMLLIVHPEDKVYAFRQMDFVDGIDSMSMAIVFPYWDTSRDSLYTNKWHILMKDRNPTSEFPAYRIEATVLKLIEGSDNELEMVRPTNWKGYYYVVDNENYTVTSLDNARNKVLTPALEGVDAVNAVNGATDYVRYISLPTTRVLLVIYNETYPVYAYRYYTAVAPEEGKEKTDDKTNLFFRVTATEPYDEAGWRVVVQQ